VTKLDELMTDRSELELEVIQNLLEEAKSALDQLGYDAAFERSTFEQAECTAWLAVNNIAKALRRLRYF
jgi:hypothetical protein